MERGIVSTRVASAPRSAEIKPWFWRFVLNQQISRSNQIKSNQIKSNQIKSNQIKSNQINLFLWRFCFLMFGLYALILGSGLLPNLGPFFPFKTSFLCGRHPTLWALVGEKTLNQITKLRKRKEKRKR
jgi:hypothetical protein